MKKNLELITSRVGIAATTLSVIPVLAFAAYVMSPTEVSAGSDSSICVTAQRVDDSKIVSKRGACPAETVTPTTTPTPSATATAAPTATVSPTPTPTPVNNFASLTWSTKTNFKPRALAISADGTKMIGGDDTYADIFLTVDSGATWTKKLVTSGALNGVAMSADGTKMISTEWNGGSTPDNIWGSTNSGATWTKMKSGTTGTYGGSRYNSPVISDDGTVMMVSDDYYVTSYVSTNNGVTWASLGRDMRKTSMSSNGQIIIGGKDTSKMYLRTDSGAYTLLPPLSASTYSISSTSMSADGKTILVGTSAKAFFISRDSGATWEEHVDPVSTTWGQVAVSDDGTKMAIGNSTVLYVSTDSGVTWKDAKAPAKGFPSINFSPDGSKITVAQSGQWSVGTFGP